MGYLFDPRELEALIQQLPVGPAVLARLHELLHDEAVATVDIVLAVRLDPTLATSVLRVARSPLYAAAQPAETLDEAVVRLGFREVTRIVACTAMRQLADPLPIYGESADFVWRKSLGCAMAMEMLAAAQRQPTEPAYLVGLLHGIGAVLLQRVTAKLVIAGVAIDPAAAEGVAPQELRIYGLHQGNAAAHALAAWNLPSYVIHPIEHQFAPSQAGEYAGAAAQLVHAKRLSLAALGRLELTRSLPGPDAMPSPELVAELRERLLVLDQVSAALDEAG